MKLLVISDIHSNIWALEQILAVEKEFDMLCCAGDLTDYGTAPSEVIDRMRQLENAVLVQGNHDLHVAQVYRTGGWEQMEPEQYKWVHHNCRRLNEHQVQYLETLPTHAVFEADGYTYLVIHQYDGAYGTIESVCQFDQFWEQHVPKQYLQASNRRMIFGHTHRQGVHVLAEDRLWINPGSVSYRRPDDPDKTAHYAVIQDGRIELRRVFYERTALLQEAEDLNQMQGMMETELQDFFFFFGEAKTSRDPLPKK